MHVQPTTPERYPRRLHELEEQFSALDAQIEDSPHKQALSALHGMIHELWRSVNASTSAPHAQGLHIQDIADLYRHAPPMEAPAASTPLPSGTPAPDFALPDASGRLVRLSEYRGTPVVLVFYPLDWSPGHHVPDIYQVFAKLDEVVQSRTVTA